MLCVIIVILGFCQAWTLSAPNGHVGKVFCAKPCSAGNPRTHSQGEELDPAAAAPAARPGSALVAEPRALAQQPLRGAHSNGDAAGGTGAKPGCQQHLPPLAFDVRLPPMHPKAAAQLYLLAAGHGSLFAGTPCRSGGGKSHRW